MQAQYWQGREVYQRTPTRRGFGKNRIKTLNFGPDKVHGLNLNPIADLYEKRLQEGVRAGCSSVVEIHDTVVRGYGYDMPYRAKKYVGSCKKSKRSLYVPDCKVTMDGKIMWLHFSLENPDLYGVPKVYALRMHDRQFVYIMEKYESTLVDEDMPDLYATQYSHRNHGDFVALSAEVQVQYMKCMDTLQKFKDWLRAKNMYTRYRFDFDLYEFDIHGGNIMLDKEGELRIIDPAGSVHKQKRKVVH